MENSITCSSSEEMRYWKNADSNGNNISYTKVATIEICMDLCMANDQCNAFTYDTTNRFADLNCWFKTSPVPFDMESENAIGLFSGMRCSVTPIEEPARSPDAIYPEGLFKMLKCLSKLSG